MTQGSENSGSARPGAGRHSGDRRDDLALARRIAAGDEAALAHFLHLYRAPLRAFIGHRLAAALGGAGGEEAEGRREGGRGEGATPGRHGPPSLQSLQADVDDVEQETLVAAVQAAGSFSGRSALFTWLCGIARHKVGDLVRRRGREPQPLPLPPAGGPLARLADTAPLPDAVVEDRAARALVVEALWSLPEAYRLALLARYVEGQTVTALAARLGRGYKATESVLSRARRAFKRRLLEVERGDRRETARGGGGGDGQAQGPRRGG